jgi:hypothetical protein
MNTWKQVAVKNLSTGDYVVEENKMWKNGHTPAMRVLVDGIGVHINDCKAPSNPDDLVWLLPSDDALVLAAKNLAAREVESRRLIREECDARDARAAAAREKNARLAGLDLICRGQIEADRHL